jgi:GntR family transcriptional regulator/MocR family aminotransferase
MVVPQDLIRRSGEIAACLAPAPAAAVQRTVAEFLRQGCYLRDLRRMKHLYASRRETLLHCLRETASSSMKVQATAGLAVVISLPEVRSDVDIALRATVRPSTGSPIAVVHSIFPAAGIVARRN